MILTKPVRFVQGLGLAVGHKGELAHFDLVARGFGLRLGVAQAGHLGMAIGAAGHEDCSARAGMGIVSTPAMVSAATTPWALATWARASLPVQSPMANMGHLVRMYGVDLDKAPGLPVSMRQLCPARAGRVGGNANGHQALCPRSGSPRCRLPIFDRDGHAAGIHVHLLRAVAGEEVDARSS